MNIFCTDSHRPSPVEIASALIEFASRSSNKIEAGFFRMAAEAAAKAEVFEFGDVPEKRLKDEAKRGGELYNAKLLDLPYSSVIYWYNCVPEPETVSSLTEIYDKHTDGKLPLSSILTEAGVRFMTLAFNKRALGIDENIGSSICALDFSRLNDMLKQEIDVRRKEGFALISGGVFSSANKSDWEGNLYYPMDDEFFEKNGKAPALGSLADGVMSMSMILQTKGIGLRREEPSEKLNKKRAASGKPLMPAVTYVNAKAYFEAARNTRRGGSHASPVPHLRRGHIRTYEDGRKVWIRDALVNCRSISELHLRDRYEVETA
jgi:hypothetical protein